MITMLAGGKITSQLVIENGEFLVTLIRKSKWIDMKVLTRSRNKSKTHAKIHHAVAMMIKKKIIDIQSADSSLFQ